METPTSRILQDAEAPLDIVDERGRKLRLRKVSALDRLRLFKAIGPDLAQNMPYLGIALLAISVTAIDDVPVPAPVTEGQLEALVQRLGDEGLAKVANILADSASEIEDKSYAGNLVGIPI